MYLGLHNAQWLQRALNEDVLKDFQDARTYLDGEEGEGSEIKTSAGMAADHEELMKDKLGLRKTKGAHSNQEEEEDDREEDERSLPLEPLDVSMTTECNYIAARYGISTLSENVKVSKVDRRKAVSLSSISEDK